MTLVRIHWKPSNRQLRQFGAGTLVVLPVLGWMWAGGNPAILGWAAGVGAVVAAVGWIRPRWLAPLFVGLSLLTLPIGWLVGEVVLLTIFGCLFWPIGLLRRWIAGDPLQRQFDRGAATYWQPKSQPADPASYFRQF